MLKTVIIDNDQKAIDILSDKLKKFSSEVQVLQTFTGLHKAVSELEKLKPDCIFLEPEMAGKNGFSVLEELNHRDFHLIITSSHEGHAYQAFRYKAADYLLKPVCQRDLESAVEKVQSNKRHGFTTKKMREALSAVVSSSKEQKRIPVSVEGKVLLITISDIIYCKSDGNYTHFHLTGGKKLIFTRNLKQACQLIDNPDFLRVHHSYLVNLDHVNEYVRGNGGFLVMNNRKNIPVSRSYKNNLIEVLGIK